MNRRAWLGYIWSMEKKLYNKKQFYPGFKNNKIKLDKSNLSSRIVCHIEQVGETCWEEVECGDEISDGCTGTVTCYPNYEEVCYDDGYDDNPCYDSCDPDCSNFSYDPCNCDGDCGGTGGGNNPIPGNLENIINLGTKPIAEYSNKCTGIQNIWNSYPNNEVTGYITQDNQLLVIDVLPYSGGTTSGTYTHNSITYYPYPDSDGPPTNSYNGMLHSSGYYLIPVKASVHTHSPCRTDGTNGVSHSVGSDDLTRAQKAPNIKHFIVGCGAIAEYNGTSSNFFNVQTGSLSTLCNNIQ